jgi:hypothetical protein
MDELITVELKQKNTGLVRYNGDFTTILRTPIEITEGTSINISKVFIDSVGESQASVLVPEDLNFTFSANIYNVNWNLDGKSYINSSPITGENIDCKKYIACDRIDTGELFSGYTITAVNFLPINTGNWGGVKTTFEYRDNENALQKIELDIPNLIAEFPQAPYTFSLSLLSKDGILTLISPSTEVLAQQFNTSILSIESKPISGNVFRYTPHDFKKTFLVKAGNYDPNFFAKLITDNLTENKKNAENLPSEFSPVDNPFLISSNDLTSSNNYYFIDSETGKNGFTYDIIDPTSQTSGYWIGSNQLSLEFADSRFYWSNLHMPIYTSVGDKCIRFINPLASSGVNTSLIVCSNSGLVWNSITTDSKDPKYINFFNDSLGFDDNITKATATETVTALSDGEIAILPIYNWNRDNFTQGLNSIDVPVQKTTGNFYQVQPCLTFDTIIDDETQAIFASSIYSQSGFSFGYYQISINSIFKHMLIGTDIKRNISAIVSRYYENNSYCTGNISDSINYVHTGEPINLSALDIRILDSNGKTVNGIGDDNSIYLEIRRQQPVQQPMIKDKKDK